MIETTFAVFGIAALLLFRFVTPARAVAITCFSGWLLLPVGHFPEGSTAGVFPYWITGAAVPSDMLLTKMWWPPVVALAGALLSDRETLARWRPGWIDIPMALWCLWPIAQWPLAGDPAPQPLIAALYLAATWGAPWLLGRLYFSGNDGATRLILAIVAGLILLAPVALVEGVLGSKVYGWLYEPHPFWADGSRRYLGFRPLAFFEDGNQYGIWVAATALAAIGLWQAAPDPRARSRRAVIAALGVIVALLSQSVGAILLLFAGLAMLQTVGRPVIRWTLPLLFLLAAGGGAIYLTGKLPVRAIAENNAVARQLVNIVKSTGRGSFSWRIATDQRALTQIREHPVLGAARWDWWRKIGQRPWGLALLIFGQFGLVGLALASGALLLPVLRALHSQWNSPAWGRDAIAPLAVIVLMAVGDALLNSFFFYPAIMAAGALGRPVERSEAERPPA